MCAPESSSAAEHWPPNSCSLFQLLPSAFIKSLAAVWGSVLYRPGKGSHWQLQGGVESFQVGCFFPLKAENLHHSVSKFLWEAGDGDLKIRALKAVEFDRAESMWSRCEEPFLPFCWLIAFSLPLINCIQTSEISTCRCRLLPLKTLRTPAWFVMKTLYCSFGSVVNNEVKR